MASKIGMAGGLPERRVRPIWDAVDSRQYKNAMKLVTTLLGKFPNSPYALALKALILERMGKPDEALSVCLDAKDHLYSDDIGQMDDLTLSTLQLVFQRLDRLDLATSCYEYVCRKYGNNLELMMGLFNCYVREYSFVKQQQTAIKMYKLVGEERFLLWAVCSIQLQVFCGDGGEKLLSLAEALLKKHISSHDLHEPEAFLVYISVLEEQRKYGEALEVLSGKLGSLISFEVDRLRMQGKLLAFSCDYAAAADTFEKILESCPDDWEMFLHYLDCLLEADSGFYKGVIVNGVQPTTYVDLNLQKATHLTNEVFASRISRALDFVEKLNMQVSNDSGRCSYLADIEIEKRLRLYGKSSDRKFIEVMMNYFYRFGHLSSFTSDVQEFLKILEPHEKDELVEKLRSSFEGLTSPEPMKALGQAITIFRINGQLYTVSNLPQSELEGNAIKMTKIYCRNLPLSKDLDPQENMHGEELLSLACNVLVQLFWRTKDLGYILEAIIVLEFGLTIRRHVWQYKILLVHLYSYMGALSSAYECYKTLDVKNILLETVSHHIWPYMLLSPLWSDLSDLLKEYLKFLDDHFREAADLAFLAYRHRNYSKVIEFVRFRERLQQSYQYLSAKVEDSILQLKQKADNIEDIKSILQNMNSGAQLLDLVNEKCKKPLTFNEDLQSRPWWSPFPDENYLLGTSGLPRAENLHPREREAQQLKVIKRRALLPRLVYLSLQSLALLLVETSETDGHLSDAKSSLELRDLLEQYTRHMGFSFDDARRFISTVSTGRMSFKDNRSELVDWINFAVFDNVLHLCSRSLGLSSDGETKGNLMEALDKLLQQCLTDSLQCAQSSSVCTGSSLTPLVQIVTEPIAWHLVILQSCSRVLFPSVKKKKKGGAPDPGPSLLSQAVRNSTRSLRGEIEKIVKWLDVEVRRVEDESLNYFRSLLRKSSDINSSGRPGRVIEILEASASARNGELGPRISRAIETWSSEDAVKKTLNGQKVVLSEFHHICCSMLKSLQAPKQL
ncbi:hypothetical protein AMTRI_Chr08g207790 [Amborella trichopoda]